MPKALPIRVLKKGEMDKIAANTEAAAREPIAPPPPTPKPKVQAPSTEAKKDFRQYLNVYNFKCELPGTKDIIEFKPLTVANMKEVATMEPGIPTDKDDPIFLATIFDKIFEKIIVSDFNNDAMFLNDRFSLILEIRKKTSGETYQWNLKCPKCNSQSIQVVNFDAVNIIEPPQDVDHVITLSEQLSVVIDYLRRADEKEAHAYYSERHKNDKEINTKERPVELAQLMIAASIKSIITPNGEEEASFADKVFLVENVPQALYKKISDWQTKYYFGPDLKIHIKCPHCDFEMKQDLETSDFFS